MERVLEQHVELIDQYKAEEIAQREWEKKFRELSSSSAQSMERRKHEHTLILLQISQRTAFKEYCQKV